jgi:hypothetical protein
MKNIALAFIVFALALILGCGQMDYEVGHRTVCGDEYGPCEDAGNDFDADADAGADADKGVE